MNKELVVAVVPARMGSKGVPRKNIKELGGRPLVCWTLEAALAVDEIDEVWLSTESQELSGVVSEYFGGEAEKLFFHQRQPQYAQDHVQTDEVYCDWLRYYQYVYQKTPEILTLLQPTSPFRNHQTISNALGLYHARMPRRTIVSVLKMPDGYYWHGMSYGEVAPIGHDPRDRLGRQDDEFHRFFKESGAIYVTHGPTFSKYRSYRKDPFFPLVLSKIEALDIDTPEDWETAEGVIEKGLVW